MFRQILLPRGKSNITKKNEQNKKWIAVSQSVTWTAEKSMSVV